jgi:CRP-like cAMP-binding protein
MLIVVQGSVRGEMTDFSGRKLKIEDIPAPRPLAAAFIFGRDNRFPVDIIANEPSVILVIPRDVLVFLLQHSQVVLKNYLNAISSRTQFLSNKIRFLSFKTIKEKIANYILSNLGNDSNLYQLNQSQTELAEFFGVARPSLARALSEMEDEGILRVERRDITILNKEKLNNLLNNH